MVGILGCQNIGLSEYWAVGILGCQNSGLSEYWAVGILGCRNIGLLEYWAVGIVVTHRCYTGQVKKTTSQYFPSYLQK